MNSLRYALLSVVLGMFLAACGGGVADDPNGPGQPPLTSSPGDSTAPTLPESDPPSGIEPSFPFCEDLGRARAPDSAYRDRPIYVGNEQPVEQLRVWAEQQPGFETLWIDRERNGWVTLAFSQDAATRQQELVEQFPDVGVVAVEVDWTETELAELQDRVVEVLQPLGWSFTAGSGSALGYVSVGIGVLSPERLAVLEDNFAGESICVSGMQPDDAIPDGPQPTGGTDWRLLGAEIDAGRAYWTSLAWDDDSYQQLWAEAGLTAVAPEVDFETEIVIWFGAVYGSSCPGLRLDDVVIDQDRQLIHGEIVLPSSIGAGGCTADARPHAFVVAVPRDRLPGPPFFVQLSAQDPPGGVPEERAIVDADLRAPGSVALPGSITRGTFDPEQSIQFAGPDAIIEPGFPTRVRLHTHCGIDWVGLNGVTWFSDNGSRIPDEWVDVVEIETIIVEVLITEGDPPTLTATANDFTVTYEAVPEPLPGCD